MRKRFEVQLGLGQPAIENVVLPKHSGDELPRLLKALQWIFKTTGLNEAIFEFLDNALLGSKQSTTGRPGMDLWHILVLETNVHYPTDLNLLWDAAHKSIEILSSPYEQLALEGWLKKAYWKRHLKKAMRTRSKVFSLFEPHTELIKKGKARPAKAA